MIKHYEVPLFVPFNIRNKIINETGKDINEYSLCSQSQVLSSFMSNENIDKLLYKENVRKIYSRNPSILYSRHRDGFRKHTSNFTDVRKLYGSGSLRGVFIEFAGGFDDTSLKAYWRFNQASGTITNDSTSAVTLGSSADLTTTGSPNYNQSSGPFNYSMQFTGSNYAKAGTSTSQFNFLHNTSALWTIAWWMKRTANVSNGVFLNTSNDSGSNPGMGIFNGASNLISVFIDSTTRNLGYNTPSNYIPDSTNWYFYVITFDKSLASNNLTIKRNDANTQNASSSGTFSNNNAYRAFTIAGDPPAGDNSCQAYFAEVSVWNKVMSSADQTTLYNSGSGKTIY